MTTEFDHADVTPALAEALGVDPEQPEERFETGLFEVVLYETESGASLDGKPCTFGHVVEDARLIVAADLAHEPPGRRL